MTGKEAEELLRGEPGAIKDFDLPDIPVRSMPRRDFLRYGALAGGAVLVGAWIGSSASAATSQKVHGYFGTFDDLSDKRYGWPSLEHDPVNDSFWTAMQKTAKVDRTGMQFANIDANGSQPTQVQNAINFLSQGYNAIYINTGTPSGWDRVIKEAKSSNAYTMNHSPDPLTGATQNVVIDHAEAGHLNATAAAAWAKANNISQVNAATLAILNSVPLKLRTDTFKASLKKLVPNATIYPDVAVPLNNANASAAAAQNLLTAHPDLNVLFSYNDSTGVAVATALAKQGTDDPKKFWIGGVDGITQSLEDIASGKSTLQATAAFLFNYSSAYLQKDLETVMSGGKIFPSRALLPVLAVKKNANFVKSANEGFLLPKNKHLYATLMHYFPYPLTTGGPLPSIIKKG
jgi:ABC-type sugar transport system substrate-binding protein